MSEVVLQTIVEKLEAIEISLLKEVKSVKSEFLKLPLEFIKNTEKTEELFKSITALNTKLDSPKTEYLKHTHHLHKGMWIAVGSIIISLLVLWGWINCISAKKTFEADHIKYRFLKVNNNPSLSKILFQTDSVYNLNEDSFAKLVIAKEKFLEQQAEQFRLAGEKKTVRGSRK